MLTPSPAVIESPTPNAPDPLVPLQPIIPNPKTNIHTTGAYTYGTR